MVEPNGLSHLKLKVAELRIAAAILRISKAAVDILGEKLGSSYSLIWSSLKGAAAAVINID